MSKGHGTHTQHQLDDYANQHNPKNHAYWDDLDNHANQCSIAETMMKMTTK